MNEAVKKYAPWVVGVLILAFGFLVYTGNINSRNNDLNKIREKIAGVESQIKTRKLTIQKDADVITELVTGSLGERRVRDDEIAEGLFKQVFEWDSYKRYNEVRDILETEYKMDPQGPFLQTFFPEVINETVKKSDGSTEDINRIDVMEMRNQLVDFTSYNTKVEGSTYTYFTWVKWSARNNTKTTMGVTETLVSYSIDANGEIFDVYAYGLPAGAN